MKAGADFLVVGRPLTKASDPLGVAAEMLKDAKRVRVPDPEDGDG
jgi:orotidine-5'-phosphate decarboxylase